MEVTCFGRYRLSDSLGQGGMGQVHRAYDPELNREVALKVVDLPGPEHNTTQRQRFKREVRAAARLSHPHIVTIYDVDLEHQPPYVVMELLTGGTLRERLQAKRLPWQQALSLLRPLVLALAYAHRVGIIHRDLKPANIMFTGDDILKLVDFGLARWQNETDPVTRSGDVFGTPAYMSPEQARGELVDSRADLFALGLILFETITGQNPLAKSSTISTLLAASDETPLDLTPLTGLAPAEVIGLIERAVTKNRAQRYPTGEALLADLDRCLTGSEGPAENDRYSLNHRSSPPLTPTPIIDQNNTIKLGLNSEIETVLRAMFSKYSMIIINAEFGHGLSGGRVFRISPVRGAGEMPDLPAVVKVAPLPLIHQEWQAYQTWVADKLPGAVPLKSDLLTLPSNSRWDGLWYGLANDDVSKVQSLQDYYDQARTGAGDLRMVLEKCLFPKIKETWWLNQEVKFLRLQDDYDALLPVNLLLKPCGDKAAEGADTGKDKAGSLERQTISLARRPETILKAGTEVELLGFVVTEVDIDRHQVTLNLPPAGGPLSASYRLRLIEVTDPDNYRVGQVVDSLTGMVVETRHKLLAATAHRILGDTIDLSADQLPLPPGSSLPTRQPVPLPATLPNPLLAYQAILEQHQKIKTSVIHGDLNLENILVRPNPLEVYLIDFLTVRRGHALHDLLRLETEIVTKLLPAALADTNLPPSTIYFIYRKLHLALLQNNPDTVLADFPPAFQPLLTMLIAIRKMIPGCLFDPMDWSEYYRSLTLYLLGALKFKNLDQLATAPRPKQVAFWAAASAVELSQQPPSPPLTEAESAGTILSFNPLIIRTMILVGVFSLALALFWFFRPNSSPPGELIATLTGFNPDVKVQRLGTEHQAAVKRGESLYQGDILHTYEEASAQLLCLKPRMFLVNLEAGRNMTINERNCTPNTTMASVVADLSQFSLNLAVTPPLTQPTSGERATRGIETHKPLLLIPRNTVITETRPTFTWLPVARASGYQLTLTPDNGESWSRQTTGSSLPYPVDAPPLKPGSANIVELTALDESGAEATDKTVLRILNEAGQSELAQAEVELRALPLDEGTRTFLLAQLYHQYGLGAAAFEQLAQLAAGQPAAAQLWQQLGDLDEQMELYLQAQTAYHQALVSAQASGDLSAQAAAEIGLARVGEDTAQAIDHLTTAESLYRQAGQSALADQVAAERARLE